MSGALMLMMRRQWRDKPENVGVSFLGVELVVLFKYETKDTKIFMLYNTSVPNWALLGLSNHLIAWQYCNISFSRYYFLERAWASSPVLLLTLSLSKWTGIDAMHCSCSRFHPGETVLLQIETSRRLGNYFLMETSLAFRHRYDSGNYLVLQYLVLYKNGTSSICSLRRRSPSRQVLQIILL